MTIFQMIALLFALFMIYVVSIHKKKKALSLSETSFWVTLWILFAIIALFPDLLSGITGALRFSRVFDLLLVLALMVLTIMMFFVYFSHKDLKQQLEHFVRQEAIETTVKHHRKQKLKNKSKKS